MYNSVLNEFDVPARVIETRKAWSESDYNRDKELTAPKDIVEYTDLQYGPFGPWNLMDIYHPSKENEYYTEGKYPVIIDIHGGGYFYGDKGLYSIYCKELAHRGFAVVNFNYRLSPEHRFPAPLDDFQNLVKWLVENAEKYNIDLNNVFLTGDSAGAQLASQVGALYSNEKYASYFGYSFSGITLRGISLSCGMYDIKERAGLPLDKNIMLDYLGEDFDQNDPRIDVLSYITSSYPSTYLYTAHNDMLKDSCEPMYNLLKGKGVDCEWDIYGTPEMKNVGHVFQINIAEGEAIKANEKQTEFLRARIVK